MNQEFYTNLTEQALSQNALSTTSAFDILESPEIEILPLLQAAFTVRRKHWGKEVMIHIINNGQNGHCPEDCSYCAQAKTSKAEIQDYGLKTDDEFIAEAKTAYEKGAHRYCMVFAGRGPSQTRTERLANLIKKIKSQYPLEICVSAGLLDSDKAQTLKDAGLDRLNHNLNTSEKHYSQICTTHTYADRLETLNAAQKAGLQLCSGIIVGMGEKHNDIIEVASTLREKKVESIPINFFMSIEGTALKPHQKLTPDFCLRVLCLFRFLNPKAEIRMAAGREVHLRSLEVMGLYAANSLFLDGYLNTKGAERRRTFQMIHDAGFTIKSDQPLETLIENENIHDASSTNDSATQTILKGLKELRPQQSCRS